MPTGDNHPYGGPSSEPVRRREAAGRRSLNEFLGRATAELGRPVAAYDLVDLPTTDNLADEMAAKLAACAAGSMPCRRQTLSAADLPKLVAALTAENDSDPERPVILFRKGSDHCGAVVATLESVLSRLGPLLDAEAGTLFVGTKDMSDGFRLRPAAESHELTLWGDNWLPALGG